MQKSVVGKLTWRTHQKRAFVEALYYCPFLMASVSWESSLAACGVRHVADGLPCGKTTGRRSGHVRL